MRNGFFGFVTHVGEAEGLAFEFAVAGVDDEMMFFAKSFRERQDVKFFSIVLHTGERFRAESFFGEEVE